MMEAMSEVPDAKTLPPPPAAGAYYFQTDHLRTNLKGRSVRGGAMMMAAQGASFILGLVSVAILARLLNVADFGLVAMVTAITGFVGMFKDAGLSMATIQRDQVTHEQVSTLFWINVTLSVILMGLVAAMAPAIAWFYGEPRLLWITLAIAGTFLLGGLAIQHQALLQRQMRFGTLAAINVTALASGIAAAIVSAKLGLGYWSLVIQLVVAISVGGLGVWTTCRWRPGPPIRGAGVRPMLAFGGNLTGFSFINYFARNTDNVLIGWYWGAGPLGFYSKAYQLLLLPIIQINSPMSAVAIPALSRLQGEPERFKRFYHKALGLMIFIGMPVVAFLLVEAREVVLLVLGDKWLPSVAMFRALGAAAFMGTLNVTTGWVYISLGRTDRQLMWGLISVPLTLLGFAIGLPFGAVGVALAFSISQTLLYPIAVLFCYRGTFMRPRELAATIARPAVASLIAAAGLFWIQHHWLRLDAYWQMILVGGGVYVVLYAALWLSMPGGATRIREYASMLQRGKRP